MLSLGPGLEVLQILLGPEEGKAARSAAGDDGDIVHRVHVLQVPARHRVAGLVKGGETPGLVAHLAGLLLGTHLHLQDGLVDILHVDEAVLAPHGQQRRLVHEVLQIRAGKAGGALGDGVEVHIFRQLLVSGVDLQNGLASADIRQAHIDLAVEAAGAQERVVQNVGPVGGRHDDDALVGAETVHLHQQLVEGLLTLVVAATETAASLAAHGVDLVDKDDGGGGLFGLLKQVADTARAHAHIQLHEVRAGDGEELHAGLARHGLGQQGLAGARRAHQQDALGDAGAHGGVGFGVLEEIDDLAELLLLLVAAGHVVEGLLVLLVAAETGAGLGELGHAARAAGTAHHEVPQDHGPAHDQNIGQHAGPPGHHKALVIVVLLQDTLFVLLLDEVAEVVIEHTEAVEVVGHLLRGQFAAVGPDLENDGVALGGEGLDLFFLEKVNKVGIVFQFLGVLGAGHGEDDSDHDRNEQNIEAKVSGAFRIQILVTSL